MFRDAAKGSPFGKGSLSTESSTREGLNGSCSNCRRALPTAKHALPRGTVHRACPAPSGSRPGRRTGLSQDDGSSRQGRRTGPVGALRGSPPPLGANAPLSLCETSADLSLPKKKGWRSQGAKSVAFPRLPGLSGVYRSKMRSFELRLSAPRGRLGNGGKNRVRRQSWMKPFVRSVFGCLRDKE